VIVGTGGIGSGISMRLDGDHLLGREESRSVTLLGGRDYCKLHIVFHYLQVFLGHELRILPIGKVGDDEAGERLRDEMAAIGLSLRHVTTVAGANTLFSVAFSYPNGEGGNLTTAHSASGRVSAADVRLVEPELAGHAGSGIAVALPEVPLSARHEMLRMAGRLGFRRVATFVSGEAPQALAAGMLDDVDLLVLNRDEAAAFTCAESGRDTATFVEQAVRSLLRINERLSIVITAGASGSWSWDGTALVPAPAIKSPVRSTAGAGDAHLAGILTGLSRGLDLPEANRFGAVVSSLKVSSQHTINPDIDWETVRALATARDIRLPDVLRRRAGESE
jgi:ribokinase